MAQWSAKTLVYAVEQARKDWAAEGKVFIMYAGSGRFGPNLVGELDS